MANQPPQEAFWVRWSLGSTAFFLANAFAAFRLLLLEKGASAHYALFTKASLALSQGLSPYQSDFGTQIGYFFYSPACALEIFYPLSLFPFGLGLSVFTIGSCFLFRKNSESLLKRFEATRLTEELYWLFLTPIILGAIWAVKLELLTMALLLWSATLYLSDRKILSGFVLGVITSWKLQTLPFAGLLFTAEIFSQKKIKTGLGFAVGFMISFLIPLLWLNASFYSNLLPIWLSGLQSHMESGALHFENIFAALKGWTGIETSSAVIQGITLATGLAFFLSTLYWAKKKYTDKELLLWILGLSGFFSVTLPPLHQNNANILVSPLLLSVLLLGFSGGLSGGFSRRKPFPSRFFCVALGFAFFILAFSYSDLIPDSMRDAVYEKKPKLFAHLILFCVFLHAFLKKNLGAIDEPHH